MRFHKVCEKFARRFPAFYDYAIRQIELIVCWILRHDAVPVALVKRVEMLIDDGLRGRPPLQRR
jgi:hypothetical protein